MKEKELVTLRSKALSKGSKSLYLDYTVDGVRYKDYLQMYIVPGNTQLIKRQNEETMRLAQAAKSKKVLEIQSGSINLKRRKKSPDIPLYDYVVQQAADYKSRGHVSYGQTLEKIARWVKQYQHRVSLRAVDKQWLMSFVEYMSDNGLGGNTIHVYFSNLNTIFNRAYRAEMIHENPISRMSLEERPQKPDTEREYLTLKEVKALMKTPCGNDTVKKAFLFSCFTGLRLSDVERLRWSDIKPAEGGKWQVEERQMKTKKIVAVPLSDNALAQLPPFGSPDEYVWTGLPSRNEIGANIKRWVRNAGITKHITFHCARHTNATLLLTYGADIYTVSALLGHTNIATTQIYARVVNQKKRRAVNLIPKI